MVIKAKKGEVGEWKSRLLNGSYDTVNQPGLAACAGCGKMYIISILITKYTRYYSGSFVAF
jgi:hypothetical protein